MLVKRELPEGERTYPACGSPLPPMGFYPAQVRLRAREDGRLHLAPHQQKRPPRASIGYFHIGSDFFLLCWANTLRRGDKSLTKEATAHQEPPPLAYFFTATRVSMGTR